MNYTEKYHLPQWVKEDRIMMEDFNQMCRDMEAGLAEHAANGQVLAERIGQVEQEAKDLAEAGGSSAKSALLQGLFRAAWNHYFHLLDAEKDLWQIGVFSQSFARGAGGKVSGMLQQDNMVWTGQFQNTTGASAIGTVTKVRTMAESGSTYSCTFSARWGAHITGIKLTGDNSWTFSATYPYTVRLLNKSRHVVEAEVQVTLKQISSTRFTMPVDLILHGSCSYQLDIIREDQTLPQIWIYLLSDSFEMEDCPNTSGVATLSVKGNEANLGGLFLAHYAKWGKGGTLSLNWDGKVFAPDAVRTITTKNGQTLNIAEFRRDSEIPVNSTMTLTLTCEENGELELYRMGGILV